jgi:hypothetical protein
MELLATISPNTDGKASLQAFEVRVRSLSNTAITMSLDSEADNIFRAYSELKVSLNLPARVAPYTIACVVRNRSALEEAIVYSCEFDWSATVDPLGVVEDLLEYTLDG